jgi:hypothetical protein
MSARNWTSAERGDGKSPDGATLDPWHGGMYVGPDGATLDPRRAWDVRRALYYNVGMCCNVDMCFFLI